MADTIVHDVWVSENLVEMSVTTDGQGSWHRFSASEAVELGLALQRAGEEILRR